MRQVSKVLKCLKLDPQVKSGLGRIFNIWDIGGQDKTRPLWRSYTRATDAIIFVVDSSDKERLEEAKLELQRISRLDERRMKKRRNWQI